MSQEVITYRKHMNLKLAANELGIAWQTLYCRLKAMGEPVAGDKLRYGTDRDRLGAMGEAEFKRLVPFAVDNNEREFQSKFDFTVAGWKVDVKAALPRRLSKRFAAQSWAFSFKRQSLICDFMCCFCFDENKANPRILLVPSEFFRGLQTVSVSCAGESKWLDYTIPADELAQFFADLPPKAA